MKRRDKLPRILRTVLGKDGPDQVASCLGNPNGTTRNTVLDDLYTCPYFFIQQGSLELSGSCREDACSRAVLRIRIRKTSLPKQPYPRTWLSACPFLALIGASAQWGLDQSGQYVERLLTDGPRMVWQAAQTRYGSATTHMVMQEEPVGG
ncbi:hypothetical protein LX36DRAFT_653615 [Colletotrichum falcatum]|nr:hypothetical protein LX36DRAFT_653615 [Colletotrichum falcatum]